MPDSVDIVIAGSGMVGAALAAALADTPLRVAVIDPQVEPTLPDDFELRVSAITPTSRQLLDALGIWSSLQDFRLRAFHEMHVWESGSDAEIHFDGAAIGVADLGYIVENRAIEYFLQQRLQQAGNVQLIRQDSVTGFRRLGQTLLEVHTANGLSLRSPLLVGADGQRSRVRQLAGIETSGWPYDQSALVATVQTEQPNRETAWQCFLPTGPLAFLPLQKHLSSIVWSTTPDQAETLCAMSSGEFELALTTAFERRLGSVQLCSDRRVFPLQLQYAQRYVADGIALIGDAAHSIHPLAGQGVNLGLMDAACLADVVLAGQQRGVSVGQYSLLRKYERWRKGDNLMMMYLMDAFKRLFAVQAGPIREVRQSGLRLTNAIGPLKNVIMQSAAGLRGELPDLLVKGRR